ncbi:MAG: ATP-binding protein [Bacteroidota bacterium]
MELLQREIESQLIKALRPNKAVLLLGPRRVGKTVMLKKIASEQSGSTLFLNGEDQDTIDILERRSIQNYRTLLNEYSLLVVDEAQKIPDIGLKLKLIVDEIDHIKVIASGSSAFDINNQTGEPLTGRKTTFRLFPFSENELSKLENPVEQRGNLRERLVFGNYPELTYLTGRNAKEKYLRELLESYLLKDILAFDEIRMSDKIFSLLRLIAYQIGQDISYTEIGRQLGMSKNTVESYLDILEKVFILYRVGSFSSNLRKEVAKAKRWYFYDNGVRNAIISNYSPIDLRNDVGQLWENYVVAERAKFLRYREIYSETYFWRTYDQQEIDWIESKNGQLDAYEIKWSNKKKFRVPVAWRKAYPESTFEVISPDNFLGWVKPE